MARSSNLNILAEVIVQAVPNALSQIGLVFVGFVTIVYVSRTNDRDVLGGVGMGTMLLNLLGLSLGFGITSALETFVSQANGACNYTRSGLFLQKAVFIATAICIPACMLLWFAEDILIAIGQGPMIAFYAGEYVRGALFSMWPMYMTAALSTYLRAQKLPKVGMCVTWIANMWHVVMCHLFIFHWRLGAWGAGLAFSSTQTVSLLMIVGYIQFVRPGVTKQSWKRWTFKNSTSDLKVYLALALPCAMLMWAEWWCAELTTLLAGYLGSEALAAHTSVLQVFIAVYMSYGGIGSAAAALVGNAIGAADADLAKRSANVVVQLTIVLCVFVDCLIRVSGSFIANVLTTDEGVYEEIMNLFQVMLVLIPLDALQTVIDGVFRGIGKQALAFKIKICCMWAIRFPLSIHLGLHTHLGVTGIWWGSSTGLGATMLVYVPILIFLNWEEEAAGSRYRRLSSLTDIDPVLVAPAKIRTPDLCGVLASNGVNVDAKVESALSH